MGGSGTGTPTGLTDPRGPECPRKFEAVLVDVAQAGNAKYALSLQPGAALDLQVSGDGDTVVLIHEAGQIGYLHRFPWGPLLKMAYDGGLAPTVQDPYFPQIAADKRAQLKAKFAQLRDEAKKLVQALIAASDAKRIEQADMLQTVDREISE